MLKIFTQSLPLRARFLAWLNSCFVGKGCKSMSSPDSAYAYLKLLWKYGIPLFPAWHHDFMKKGRHEAQLGVAWTLMKTAAGGDKMFKAQPKLLWTVAWATSMARERESRNRRGTPKKERLQIRKAVNRISQNYASQVSCLLFWLQKATSKITQAADNNKNQSKPTKQSHIFLWFTQDCFPRSRWLNAMALRLCSTSLVKTPNSLGKMHSRSFQWVCFLTRYMPSYTWMQGNYNLLNRRDAQLGLPAQKWPPAVKQYSCHSINK